MRKPPCLTAEYGIPKKFEQSDFAEDIYFGWGPTYTDGVGNQEISMKPASHPYVVSGKLQKEDPEKYAAVIDFLKYYYGTEEPVLS